MDFLQALTEAAQANGGIITSSAAAQNGVSRTMLSKLCKAGQIQRISRGQYVLASEMQDELLSIAMRSEKLVFSHETALFLHGISDRVPFEHTITAPTGCTPSQSIKSVCKIYYIKPELFDLGKTTLPTPYGNQVDAYDLERTICDIVRCRSRLGSETFLAALKLYAASPQKNLNRLNTYAKKMKIATVVQAYLEVLL